MKLNHIDPDPDDSTVGPSTPPETVLADDPLNFDTKANTNTSSIPWPGSTFILRDAFSGHVLTLLSGSLSLSPPGSRGSIHWKCIETKGWLGFKNTVSGRFLGHDARGKLTCSAGEQKGWENFCVRMHPEGGYVLLMTHFERLWHVGVRVERGVECLAKTGDGGNDGIIWEFVKV
jgi:hypothetical protein